MHDVLRKRIMRKLEGLPEAQLYQVLDYIEFLEARYAPEKSPEATGFQRFAERLEDGMRARALAARTMSGTMKLVSTAGKVIDGISSVFEPPAESRSRGPGPAPSTEGPRGTGRAAEREVERAGEKRLLPPGNGEERQRPTGG